MRVCLFEDALVADLEPVCLARPAFALLAGCTTLCEKHLRHFATTAVGTLVRPALAAVTSEQWPHFHVNDLPWLRRAPTVLVNARWLPPAPGTEFPMPDGPCVGLIDGEVAWAHLTPPLLGDCSPLTLDACLDHWRDTLPCVQAGGRLIRYLWQLVDRNADEIALDAWLTDPERPVRASVVPHLVGPADRLWIAPTARLDPLIVVDTTGGPVVIDREAVVTAFTRLEGPCYVGPGTQLMGAKIRAGTSLGPQCRVGGEVEASIILGHSNKYHDGFLGHAYVGEWVNLGAGTSNSDLRNDYGPVKVHVAGRIVDTGRSKVGCFLGDHTKAGLGCLLNTGTSAGLFAQLLPTGGLLPRAVPSFSAVWNGALMEMDDVDGLLRTASKVMSRRNRTLTPALETLYRELYLATANDRRRLLREAEVRQLRRAG